MEDIYGIDASKPITPEMVRDAILECFRRAHGPIVEKLLKDAGEQVTQKESIAEETVRSIVMNAFYSSGGDFNNPTKESLIGAINYLRDFSEGMRDSEIIQKHYSEIKSLIDKLE